MHVETHRSNTEHVPRQEETRPSSERSRGFPGLTKCISKASSRRLALAEDGRCGDARGSPATHSAPEVSHQMHHSVVG